MAQPKTCRKPAQSSESNLRTCSTQRNLRGAQCFVKTDSFSTFSQPVFERLCLKRELSGGRYPIGQRSARTNSSSVRTWISESPILTSVTPTRVLLPSLLPEMVYRILIRTATANSPARQARRMRSASETQAPGAQARSKPAWRENPLAHSAQSVPP